MGPNTLLHSAADSRWCTPEQCNFTADNDELRTDQDGLPVGFGRHGPGVVAGRGVRQGGAIGVPRVLGGGGGGVVVARGGGWGGIAVRVACNYIILL